MLPVPVSVSPRAGVTRSSLENWEARVKDSLGKNLGADLPGTGEAAIAPYLKILQESLTKLVTDAKDKLSEMPVTGDPYYQKRLVKMELRGDKRTDKEGLYVSEVNAIDAWITATLEAFDNNKDNFKDNFKTSLNDSAITTDEQARKILQERLENEKKKVEEQKNYEDILIKSIGEFIRQNARAMSLKEFNALAGRQATIQEAGQPLPDKMSFVPANKKFSYFSALKGAVHGSVYTINDKGDHTEHNFNPKDPDACKALVAYARANNASEVSLTLGGGTLDEYQQFGQVNPGNNTPLRNIAKWFIANSQGFNEVVPKKWTEDSVMKYFEQHKEVPSEFIETNLDIKPFLLKFDNCSLPELDAETERYKGIRKALKQCRVMTNENKLETDQEKIKEYEAKGGTLTNEEQKKYADLLNERKTLSTELDRYKAEQEQTAAPSPKAPK